MGPSNIPPASPITGAENNALSDKWDEVLEDELMELKSGELAFLATLTNIIQAGYTS